MEFAVWGDSRTHPLCWRVLRGGPPRSSLRSGARGRDRPGLLL